ncbi:hypothetical protein SEUCBS140593_007250 [Sporothrix eucalyptigena]|uniref:Uncharacterized protein n=1 Tax=Sporothrix eucalyptigena TaxID=1812306 RepID=A0ABP0CBM8_9PEZI
MLLHVVGYFATVIYLLVHVHEKNTAKYVFTDTTNLSGWDNAGAAWLIGLLTTAIGFVSWDSPIHMAEEMTNVARDLPRSLLITIISSAVFTFPWVIALAFCITDIGGVLAGPVGTISFMAQMFYNVSGGSQAATIGLTMFLPIMGLCGIGPSIITATSRIVWAFARDGGLPATFANVNDQTKTPVMSLVLSWALVSVLSLIYVGNATAFYGFSSACTASITSWRQFPPWAGAC